MVPVKWQCQEHLRFVPRRDGSVYVVADLVPGDHFSGKPGNHIITSHGENGSRPQRPLYPRNNDRVHFILHKILYYNTTVSDAMEICFVIIHHVLIDPEFI